MNLPPIELAGSLATILAIVGVVLNNRKRRECFAIWLLSNGIALAVHAYIGVWSLAARDLAFLGLAVEGWYRWGKGGEALA